MSRTGNFYKYYNRNPNNNITEDCVCRAISTATGLNYAAVDNLLNMTAKMYTCDKLCICCYHNLLEKVLCYERVNCKYDETVKDIAKKYHRDTLLVRIDGHLTCIVKGTILDIWDCSNEYVDCFWFIV